MCLFHLSRTASGSTHEVILDFQDTAGTDYNAVRTFVVSAYVMVPPDFAFPPGSGIAAQPGFVWNLHQNEALQGTTVQRALDQLAGRFIDPAFSQPYANNADPAAQGVSPAPATPASPAWAPISFNIPTVINLSQAAAENNGNFPNDGQMPGIPGTSTEAATDNLAAAFTTYAEFTEAGYYAMGVNSDDGFRVTVAETVPRQYIEVEAPANIAGPIGSTPAANGIDGVLFGGPIPETPIVAEAVLADPFCPSFANAEALVGKIALIDRGVCPFVDKARAAQAAGAVAAIIINDRLQYPFSMGGEGADVTIPCAMIMQQDG